MAFTFTAPVADLYNQCETLRAANNNVYLIYRFDNNDQTLEAIWDAGYRSGRENFFRDGVALHHPVEKLQRQAMNNSAFLVGANGKSTGAALRGFTHAPSENQIGGHAEEFLIQKLMMLSMPPHEIDIYISRIPCAATSMPWNFRFNGNVMKLPGGCGPKLYTAMKLTPQIKWNLAYGESYSGAMQTSCREAIDRMNLLPNAVAGHISTFLG
ncbi:hypothetical protein NUH87_20035 [Pseudomonas batumici]|uniref:hypothetical protein n=1 Tax=Pseudomonas batumici TaxID=226910 RepID=UPI0030CE219C